MKGKDVRKLGVSHLKANPSDPVAVSTTPDLLFVKFKDPLSLHKKSGTTRHSYTPTQSLVSICRNRSLVWPNVICPWLATSQPMLATKLPLASLCVGGGISWSTPLLLLSKRTMPSRGRQVVRNCTPCYCVVSSLFLFRSLANRWSLLSNNQRLARRLIFQGFGPWGVISSWNLKLPCNLKRGVYLTWMLPRSKLHQLPLTSVEPL